jgi:uncharacterized protein (DUF4415 family)
MTRKQWPSFETWDLDFETDPEAADAEMYRRWVVYDQQMKALIAKGGVHQDRDGWWIETATGELIGPDPEIERPSTAQELAGAKPFVKAHPDLAASIRRGRGRPKIESPKKAVTLRLDATTLSRFEAAGPDWRRRMADILDRAKP